MDWVRPSGLDIEVLRGIRGPSAPIEALLARIEDHLARRQGYVAFSGGKDSLVVLDLARRVDPQVPVVFFDSGLEYPQTYRYLEELAARWRLNLHIVNADPPLLTLLTDGGRWDHHAPIHDHGADAIHEALISRPAATAHRDHGPGELWGVRAGESAGRRIAYTKALTGLQCGCCTSPGQRRERHGGILHRHDGTVAYGPIWDWPTREVWPHIARDQLPLNPVYEILRRIGAPEHALRISHLIDGGHLEQGRLTWLRRGWPDLFDEIATLLPRIREYV